MATPTLHPTQAIRQVSPGEPVTPGLAAWSGAGSRGHRERLAIPIEGDATVWPPIASPAPGFGLAGTTTTAGRAPIRTGRQDPFERPAASEPRGVPPAAVAARAPTPSVELSWRLLSGATILLGLTALTNLLLGDGGLVAILLAGLSAAVASFAWLHRRAVRLEQTDRHGEIETFARILQALSRSVSPDALVSAIMEELGAATGADHVVFVRLRPNTRVLDATLVTMHPGVPASATVLPASVLDDAPPSVGPRARFGRDVRGQVRAQPDLVGEPGPAGSHGPPEDLASPDSAADLAASRAATRIAVRVRSLYGLRNTLAAPLRVQGSAIGAIVLSHRTADGWSPAANRLLEGAAREAAAALARIYTLQDAETRAATDGLTGLPNRRAFDERCTQLNRRRRADAVGVLMIDIDNFKRLNDRHGHATGDVVLRAVAAAIAGALRQNDVPARYGGEEFVVLLREPTWETAIEVGERVRAAVGGLDLSAVGVDGVTVSVGVAIGESPDVPIEALIDRADASMYAAKQAGRNRVVAS